MRDEIPFAFDEPGDPSSISSPAAILDGERFFASYTGDRAEELAQTTARMLGGVVKSFAVSLKGVDARGQVTSWSKERGYSVWA